MVKKTNWKTTTAGILGLIIAVATLLQALLTGESPNWEMVTVAVGVVFPSVAAIFARDKDVTSEGTSTTDAQ